MRSIALVTELDIFKEGESSPLMRRILTKPYMLQREKLEPLSGFQKELYLNMVPLLQVELPCFL